jgi:hypothetical protein
MAGYSIAVFDLGGVLIDWNPRYLYRKLFDGDTHAMEDFLATVCTQSWNEQQTLVAHVFEAEPQATSKKTPSPFLRFSSRVLRRFSGRAHNYAHLH